MKYNLLTIIFSLFSSSLLAQYDCSIKDEYIKIFKVEKQKYGDREFLNQSVNSLDNNSCFSDLVNNNKGHINYIRQHFTSNFNYDRLISSSDEELQGAYIKALENDQEFNDLMNKLALRVIKPAEIVQDTLTLDEMLNIAVKYFSIKGITEEGNYEGKVCGGINGIKQTEEIRRPHLEAFCFNTILNNYKGDKYNMYDEFVNGIKEIYKMNLGLENEERIFRAQGAMYMFMRNNEKLKELLIYEYERKKNYLPFILKEN